MNVLALSIGLGLGVSLLFSEFFFIAPGGMIVAGYLALFLTQPQHIILTLSIAFITFFIVKTLSYFFILYGRRRTALMILFGYLLGYLARLIIQGTGIHDIIELEVIGYIIPGLIAIWLDRQGVLETVSGLVIVSVITRLLLLLITGGEISL